MLRVAFFGSPGHFSAVHLRRLAAAHHVVGVFSATISRGRAHKLLRWLPGGRRRRLGRVARSVGAPHWRVGGGAERVAKNVADLRPDVVCIAGYPRLLPPEIWAGPPLGALNSHMSLLPRHRGILPLFWTYFHDDRQAGVTVHRVNERVDAGDIVAQEAYPLPRGFSVERLSARNAKRGSALLVAALDAIESGSDEAAPQDERLATRAPLLTPGCAMVDFNWDAERVWHFLAGLFPRFVEPLRDQDGRRAAYASVVGYERRKHEVAPGTARRDASGWDLYCVGGVVRLGADPAHDQKAGSDA